MRNTANDQRPLSLLQLVAITFVSDAFVIFALHGNITLMTVLGFALGIPIQCAMSLPLLALVRDGRQYGRTADAVCLIFLVMWGGALFAMMWEISGDIFVPAENAGGLFGRLYMTALIALVCLYAASVGLCALSRAVFIAAAVGMICVAVVMANTFISPDADNLIRGSLKSIWGELMRGFALSGSLCSFTLLLGRTKGDLRTNTLAFFVFRLVFITLTLISILLAAGGLSELAEFPTLTAARLTQPFPVQRIDSLFLIVFTVLAVFAAAVQSVLASEILKRLIPGFIHLRSAAVLALMTAAAFIFVSGDYYLFGAAAVTAVVLIVPSAELIRERVKR